MQICKSGGNRLSLSDKDRMQSEWLQKASAKRGAQ